MPRKNKRKFFGKSNKNKSAKGNRDEAASATPQHESDSDEKCGAGEEEAGPACRSGQSEDTSLVANDSAPVMGQLESVVAEAHSAVTFKEEPQNKATITLKVIQFIGEVPRDARDAGAHSPHRPDFNEIGGDSSAAYKSISDGTSPLSLLQSESHDVGEVPKLDHNKEKSSETSHCQRKFDDNYRVESPQQVLVGESHGPQRTKRHAMLIQEISESSSSEEVKQFLDTEASALELEADRAEVAKSYRIESPIDSSDENNNSKMVVAVRGDVTVQEISESSSNESVKDEILASIAKQPPPHVVDAKQICLKIINIKELPSEDAAPQFAAVSNVKSPSNAKSTSPTKLFECKTERKLNKAEEAILEALYGPKSLLQIPNLPLDAISEEGSECGSDVVDKPKAVSDDLDDDVFLPSKPLPKKPPVSRRRVAEPAVLIETKIIDSEAVPEGVKSWQTSEGDNELQAELVYLTSTSSSATDLSERNDFTDTEEPDDNSEDTETNSMLENISVPSLDFDEHDTPLEMKLLRQSPVYSTDYYQEINEQKLTDILEEDEDAAPRSLDIVESQQQIEDINMELRHLVSAHEEQQQPRARSRCEKPLLTTEATSSPSTEATSSMVTEETCSVETEATAKEEIREERLVTHLDANTLESAHEAGIEDGDKKIISDNDKPNDDVCASPVTTTRFARKDSSDSSSNDSSSNSQCTIIRQVETVRVDPLRELCAQSLKRGVGNRDDGMKITIHKKLNSASRNAPQIPIIDELELHYESADLDGRENRADRVITILQVPPEMSSASSPVSEDKRWFGLQSAQNPNVMVALSPMQKTYVMNSPDSNTTSADVLLDMHRKFVERRAYHEIYDTEEAESIGGEKSRQSQLESVNQLEDGYFGDRESSVENIVSSPSRAKCVVAAATCDNERKNISTPTSSHENSPAVKSAEADFKMNSIRNCILRDEFFRDAPVPRDSPPSAETAETFEVKKHELESEMSRLDKERRDLEEELKNLQSMQHFKREEFLFNERKKEKLKEKIQEKCEAVESNRNSQHANDFNEFLNSNERLQQELYNEWQDKVLERYERKMQKTIKITSITESVAQEAPLDRASSEILKFVPLENEFMSKLKERRQRLSLPTELNSSTESMHHLNEETRKFSVDQTKLEHVPAHLHEFLSYYEEEIAQTKNSDESGESKKALATPVLCCLIGVSICLCGLYVGRQFLTKNLKLF